MASWPNSCWITEPTQLAKTTNRWAATNGYHAVAGLLLKDPRVSPAANENFAVRRAAKNGHANVTEVLMEDPRVDLSAFDNWALNAAKARGYADVVEVLKRDVRVTNFRP
jgi:hypothetical protein